jgi:hypothetical protein
MSLVDDKTKVCFHNDEICPCKHGIRLALVGHPYGLGLHPVTSDFRLVVLWWPIWRLMPPFWLVETIQGASGVSVGAAIWSLHFIMVLFGHLLQLMCINLHFSSNCCRSIGPHNCIWAKQLKLQTWVCLHITFSVQKKYNSSTVLS